MTKKKITGVNEKRFIYVREPMLTYHKGSLYTQRRFKTYINIGLTFFNLYSYIIPMLELRFSFVITTLM